MLNIFSLIDINWAKWLLEQQYNNSETMPQMKVLKLICYKQRRKYSNYFTMEGVLLFGCMMHFEKLAHI